MFAIYCRNAKTNETFLAFHWTRTADAGIARAWRDAKAFGVEISDAWAEPVPA